MIFNIFLLCAWFFVGVLFIVNYSKGKDCSWVTLWFSYAMIILLLIQRIISF